METHINWALLVNPEKLYPVTYAYHAQRGRVAPPASGMMLGKDLTEPQIKELRGLGIV